MKKTVISLLLAAALLALILGAAAEETVIKPDMGYAVSGAEFAAENPAVDGESPLTGLPVSEPYTPVMVPLDNSPEGHPLWGIGEACILFQIPLADSGATRLMALFGDSYPEQAGGVRSARMTMLPLARAFNAVFVYAGSPPIGSGSTSVTYYLDQWSFLKPTRHYNLLGDRFRERVSFVAVPHNLSVHLKELHDHLVSRALTYENSTFLFTDTPLDRGTDASEINLKFHSVKNSSGDGNANSNCTFTWTENGYTRTSASGEMTDLNTGASLAFANVIILRVPVEWKKGYPYYRDQLRGSGQADIFQSGRYIRGSWSHEARTGRLVFLDDNNQELKFLRGKTFIVVGDEHIEASYK